MYTYVYVSSFMYSFLHGNPLGDIEVLNPKPFTQHDDPDAPIYVDPKTLEAID